VPAIIFDLDGTLADVRPFRHHVTGPNRDFHSFHTESVDAQPVPVARALWDTYGALGWDRLVVTARTDRYRHHSVWWLLLNGYEDHAGFWMRRHGDQRPDTAVKVDILAAVRAAGFDPQIAVDDNPAVLGVWKDAGLVPVVVPTWHDPAAVAAALAA
jgi:phosphoglycolate phosphatase-like HAD superfamily hydrolase